MSAQFKDWHAHAKSLKIEARAFIGGAYVQSLSGASFQAIDPATGLLLAEVSSCQSEDVDRAVQSARRAFEKGSWSRATAAERKKKLIRFSELIETNLEELALLETLSVGKPITNSLKSDIPLSANCIRWFGEIIDKTYDEVAPTANSALAIVRREPLGVVGAVVPWNFPLLMAAWKIGPALAAGNSVVLKPAEQTPLTAIRIARLAAEAGIPEGVFNVVPGYGETAGKALGLHHDVDAIAFTGSTEVGKLFMKYSGESNMKRISLECGGKSPNIVLADAPNLDEAATAAAWGIYYNQGEVCSAGSRLIVEESIKEEFLEKLVRVARDIVVGDPLDIATQMGPLIDDTHATRVRGLVAVGVEQGATMRLGNTNEPLPHSRYLKPILFDDVATDMTIAQQEIFGPVLATLSAKSMDDALNIANSTIYGLAAAVWTRDIGKAFRAAQAIRSGVVWINCYERGDISTPFGGFKQSGFGRDKSRHALEKYTDLKTTWVNLVS